MSVQNKLSAVRRLATVIRKWPSDTHKIYSSFRNAQLKLYDSAVPSQLPPAETLELRTAAATKLLNNDNAKTFPPNDRIFRPDGNPLYYDLIRREANGESRKANIVTGIRNTVFGWWRK